MKMERSTRRMRESIVVIVGLVVFMALAGNLPACPPEDPCEPPSSEGSSQPKPTPKPSTPPQAN